MVGAEIGKYCGATALTFNMHNSSMAWSRFMFDMPNLTPEEKAAFAPMRERQFRRAIAERIRLQVSEHQVSQEHPRLRITASFGIATMGPGDTEFGALFSRADRALYVAKDAGRNRTCALQPADAEA